MKIRLTYKKIQKARPGSKPDAYYGECFTKTREINIDPRQSKIEMFDTEIHEMLHAIYPYMSEKQIIRGADVLSTNLLKLGYKKRR